MTLKSLVRRLLSRRIAPHRILGGRLKGARLVTSWHDYPAGIMGRTEAALLSWFDDHVRPGATWLDVGAHYGYTALALSRLVGPGGRVFAFEPMTATAGCVVRTRALNALNQLTVVPQGLGCPDTMSVVTLPTVRGMADRTLNPADPGRREEIQIARLDWLWPIINGGDERIDGIKIDVQGMEVDVLAGMRETLASQHPLLVVELHENVDRSALFEVMRGAGYSISPIDIERRSSPSSPGADLLDNVSYYFQPDRASATEAPFLQPELRA